MRCEYLEGDCYEGKEIQIWCVHPEVVKTDICPFGSEVECELNAHKRNLQERDIQSSKESETQ